MVDPEVDSQPLFENEDRFQPFPDTQSQDFADSDPARVFKACLGCMNVNHLKTLK